MIKRRFCQFYNMVVAEIQFDQIKQVQERISWRISKSEVNLKIALREIHPNEWCFEIRNKWVGKSSYYLSWVNFLDKVDIDKLIMLQGLLFA